MAEPCFIAADLVPVRQGAAHPGHITWPVEATPAGARELIGAHVDEATSLRQQGRRSPATAAAGRRASLDLFLVDIAQAEHPAVLMFQLTDATAEMFAELLLTYAAIGTDRADT